jgi:hypothetical protein
VGSSADTAADNYTYVGPPTITSISPTSGVTTGGSWVTIYGTRLFGVTGVTFGGVPSSSIQAATGLEGVPVTTSIRALAPAHVTGTVQVQVTTTWGTTADTAADNYTYVGPPTITGLSPTMGPSAGGTTVVITGTDLTGVTGVTFGGTSASYTIDSNGQITATAPAHAAGRARVEITGATAGGAVNPNAKAYYFVYVDAPVIVALRPSTGPVEGGNEVVITGRSFVGVTAVFFGRVKAEYTVDSPTQITAIVPPGDLGTVRVQVISAGGSSSDNIADDYTYQDLSEGR